MLLRVLLRPLNSTDLINTAEIASTPGSPEKQRPKLRIDIPTTAFETPSAIDDNSKSRIDDRKSPLDSAIDAEPQEPEIKLSDLEIEGLLDRMLSQHEIDYVRDRANMQTEEKLSRNSSTSSRTSTRKILRPQGFDGSDSSPITKEFIEKTDWHTYGVYSKPKRMPSSSPSYGSTFTVDSSGIGTPSPASAHNDLVSKGKSVKVLTTIQNKDREREQIINGIAERLLRAGRNRSLSGPPDMEGTGVLDRSSTFRSPPDGTSFATIFTVQIPKGDFKAPLTKLGRPLVPDGIVTNKYTAVATYHPTYRHLVIDLMEYCLCPAGFDSNLLVDLVYLQNTGYLPTYLTWPIQEYAAKRYQVASEWSICATKANGHDILFVSDLDVMVQRIAGCMFRAHEGRTMSKTGHARFLHSISQGCNEVVEAELTCKAASLHRKPTYGTVCVDYNRSAAIEWMSLTAHPNHQLPHSRDGMPIKLF
jgi:hypothetical protein